MKTFQEFRQQYPDKVPDIEIDKFRDLDGYPLTEQRLNEIEAYEFYNIQTSQEGLKLNSRFVLSIIRELRALRKMVEGNRLALKELDTLELKLRNPHEERWK